MKNSGGNSWRAVGGRIHSLRKENCLTLKQLARGSGLSANTISLIEHGQVAPTIETLCKIAHALGVPAGSLFEAVCQADELCASSEASVPQVIFEPRSGASAAGSALAPSDIPNGEPGGCLPPRVVCVSGRFVYETGQEQYILAPGDSLIFIGGAAGDAGAHWNNPGDETAVAILIFPANVEPAAPPALPNIQPSVTANH